MQQYTYDEIFQRNIGVFTQEEQGKIKNLKIAIIGVGGLGAPAAEGLARLGVGELRLVEPDTYEVSNLNRQTGAFLDTLGRNKAEVMAETSRRINPEIKITVKTEKIFGNELKQFIDGCDIIVDGIDYFNIDDDLELHELAKSLNILVVSAASCSNIHSFSYYKPGKAMLSDLITKPDLVGKLFQATELLFPLLPKTIVEGFASEFAPKILTGQSTFGLPSYAVNAPFDGVITLQFIISLLIKTEDSASIPAFPDVLQFDMKKFEFKWVNR